MDKYWIYIALLSISFSVEALQKEGEHFPDYWQDDSNYDWYSDELEKLGILSSENKDTVDENKIQNDVEAENDRKVAEEIENFRSDIEDQFNIDSADIDLVDYQIEDNRSEGEDDEIADKKESEENLDDLEDLAADVADLNRIKESLDDSKESKHEVKPLNPIKKFDADTNDIINNAKNETDEIIQETKDILKEDDGKNDFLEVIPINLDTSNLNDTLEETKKILNSTDDRLDEEVKKIVPQEDMENILKVDEDNLKNFNEAYDDMLAWSKMADSLNETDLFNDTISNDEKELDEIYKAYIDLTDDYENIDDGHLDILLDNKKSEQKESFPDDTRSEEESKHKTHPIEYLNDALNASDGIKNPDAEMIPEIEVTKTETKDNNVVNSTITDTDYNYVIQSEYDEVLQKFKQNHSEDFNSKSENFDKHIAPIHITLSEDPVVVTSPNYPNYYPTNNIIDWIFYGDGEGIEFNITDFAVNGHVGDYLLVKPGGVDSSHNNGLIFSYTLATKRQYLFLDVNRMFVRFEAKPGMQFMRGFSFSVKILRHSTFDNEPEPSPEPIRPLPHSMITLNLGGTNLDNFNDQQVEEFRQIIADMATMYINANNIDHGLNTTLEATQIVSRAQCFHNWPKFEQCVEIKFGVSLEYDDDQEPRLNEEDLTNMWQTYFDQDPFAARLRRMGITEYQVPNDKGVLMVWLVIGCGVAISVAMLAFALWRFSCFEDYSRMPRFSDSDSIQEKRGLDLYPTPHQTLPPLYEQDYKWAHNTYLDSTRVDLGGYANKNYLADDGYGLDSDDEVADARNRYTSDV
ncbi:PREDICTED: uncharacterized protein LOC106118637 isoform X2 [Papilio xuthus]|uniref:Uncharacterized protein LOC106118637 isoform X2 n=1 Tax=Papilio xuthus TaxID=66420 RepID=A0AAJ7EA03_PAPXU|nr:PREDICTED: uncharacterized protein LOC106118637 isoform X2 [Papilio xuthus]